MGKSKATVDLDTSTVDRFFTPYIDRPFTPNIDPQPRDMVATLVQLESVDGENQSMDECGRRLMWSVFLCGSSVPIVMDLRRKVVVPYCFWYYWACT